jgi:hypothetical protein
MMEVNNGNMSNPIQDAIPNVCFPSAPATASRIDGRVLLRRQRELPRSNHLVVYSLCARPIADGLDTLQDPRLNDGDDDDDLDSAYNSQRHVSVIIPVSVVGIAVRGLLLAESMADWDGNSASTYQPHR